MYVAGEIRHVCFSNYALGEDNPSLATLRQFRDAVLAKTFAGRKFIEAYYAASDSMVIMMERSPALRAVTRRVLEVIAQMVGKKEN